jgi:4-hydroxy-tetrahydrodipicolinate synthase
MNKFEGSFPALVTPFNAGALDEDAFVKFLEWQIAEGTHGLVPVGTSGESPTLSHDEHKRVIELTIKVAKGRLPIIAGAGSNSTAEAIDFAQHAEKAGADALLVVVPYYNKPDHAGQIRHYTAVANAVSAPIFVYNVPSRSAVEMSVETLAELSRLPNIIGVKDATGKLERVSAQRVASGPGFVQLSGEDGTALAFNAHGGVGCISVTANVAPRLCAQFQEATLAGDYVTALSIQDRLYPLHEALFLEPSPQGVKFALSQLGMINNELRSPLGCVSQGTGDIIVAAMQHAGLVN